MALSDDKLWDLWNAQGTDNMSKEEAFVFARAIEAEVRKDDEALIRQMESALSWSSPHADVAHGWRSENWARKRSEAITAARARLLDSDLSNLTERGAKAWAGVDAQALREGRWYMVTHDGVATLCEDRRDAEKEAKDADMAWPHSGPHRAVQLVEASMAGYTAADMATAAAQGFRDGVASCAASAGSEPVAQLAAERDELFQAAIDFIRTLTGMEPPPIEVAPPEVFAPFHAFVNTVQAIINKRNSSPREGMVMVPKEPTHHMLNAAASAYKDARQSLGAYNAPWAAYRAMLEVAAPPTTPAGSGKGE